MTTLVIPARPWSQLADEEKAQVRYEMGACSDTGLNCFWWSRESLGNYLYWNAEFSPEMEAAHARWLELHRSPAAKVVLK